MPETKSTYELRKQKMGIKGISTKGSKRIENASEKANVSYNGAWIDWSSKENQMGLLRAELEKVKQEKEGFEFKIAKFDKSAKDLSEMLESQITDKSKKGVGYHAVPSPHPLILNRPHLYTYLISLRRIQRTENTDDSLEQHQITDTETSSVKSSLKVDKDWKEKFFYPANHVREVEPL
ncbi:hypothetical protein Tco_1335140 [Tanacetum coccineum]